MRQLSTRSRQLTGGLLFLSALVLLAAFPVAVHASSHEGVTSATTVTSSIDTQRFRLAGGFDSWVSLEGTRLGDAWQLDGALWIHAARRPMVFTLDGELGEAAVAGRVGAVAHVGFNVGRRVRLTLDLPLVIYQQGIDPVAQTALAAGGVGDLRFTPLVQVLDAEKYWLGLALSAPISFPTGNKDSYLGENGPTIQPKVSAEKRFSFTPRRWLNFAVGADLGWRFRPRTQLLDLDSAGEFTFGLGFRWEPGDIVTVGTEVVSAFGAGENARHGEWLTWVRLSPGKMKNYRVLAGVAVGLGRGVGTPEGRGYVSVQGTLGLGTKIRGGDAGVDDEEESPTAIVEAEKPPRAQPPRSTYGGTWRMVLLRRKLRIPHQVVFEEGSAVLPEVGYGDLSEVCRWLRSHPDAGRVVVRGHTGIEGDAESETVLSKSRADAVVAYMVSQGVGRKRLDSVAMGRQWVPSLPEGATEEDDAVASRRVDFRFAPSAQVAAK